MNKEIEQLLNNELSLKDFLSNDQLVEVKFEADKLTVKTTDETINEKLNFSRVDESNAVLTDVYIKLREAWNNLLVNGYLKDLDNFMNEYKVSSVDVNLKDQEVRFVSGKYHLVEALVLKK